MMITVFLNVTQCSLVYRYQYFRGASLEGGNGFLRNAAIYHSTRRHSLEDSNLQFDTTFSQQHAKSTVDDASDANTNESYKKILPFIFLFFALP
jgi:flagellar biosynthesis/type III secretory pathway M-ring protein FliF/YscJ